jgi:surface glycoprotein (TIGR04207 family)
MVRTLILAALLVAWVAAISFPASAAPDDEKVPAILESKPMEPAKGDDELHKLLKERYNAALEELQARFKRFQAGGETLDFLAPAARRLLHAHLELCEKVSERLPVYERHIEFAREVEKIQKLRHEAGQATVADWKQAQFERLELEIRLLRARKDAEPKPR